MWGGVAAWHVREYINKYNAKNKYLTDDTDKKKHSTVQNRTTAWEAYRLSLKGENSLVPYGNYVSPSRKQKHFTPGTVGGPNTPVWPGPSWRRDRHWDQRVELDSPQIQFAKPQ